MVQKWLVTLSLFGLIAGHTISGHEQGKGEESDIPFLQTPKAELNNFHVRLETSMGNIEVDLFPHFAPEHVRNFLRLSKLGFYDHTSWHRVIRGVIIQGGDLESRDPQLPKDQIARYVRQLKPEFSQLKHEEGTLSMARAQALDSALTSFFICVIPQPLLDEKYTIFGKVISGLDVVKRIAVVPTNKNDRPKTRVELIRAEVIELKP